MRAMETGSAGPGRGADPHPGRRAGRADHDPVARRPCRSPSSTTRCRPARASTSSPPPTTATRASTTCRRRCAAGSTPWCCRCRTPSSRRSRSSAPASPPSARACRCRRTSRRCRRSSAWSRSSASCARASPPTGAPRVKSPSATLSTAEAISVMTNGVALAAHFGDGMVRADDVAAGLLGRGGQGPGAGPDRLAGVPRDRRPGPAGVGRPLPRLPRARLTATDRVDRRSRPGDPAPRARLGPVGGAGARRAATRPGRWSRARPSSTRSSRCWPTPEMVPPVAGLVYAVDEPRRAVVLPVGRRSRRSGWRSRWALRHGVAGALRRPAGRATSSPTRPSDRRRRRDDGRATPTELRPPPPPADPIGMLAGAAGYDDPERWWEDAVEHRDDLVRWSGSPPIQEAMAAVRAADERSADDPDVVENARREAAMRRVAPGGDDARATSGSPSCAAPTTRPRSTPARTRRSRHDNRLLAGLPKIKVAATWAPWTSGRLGLRERLRRRRHLARAGTSTCSTTGPRGDDRRASLARAGWSRVARALRDERLDASTASVVEATRLADALAAVRGRPSVGLTELDDADPGGAVRRVAGPAAAGAPTAWSSARRSGRVPEAAPMVPLAADLARQQRPLRLKPAATDDDRRARPAQARASWPGRCCCTGCALLGIDWGTQADAGRTTGTFKEAWKLEWRPELAVAVIEAGLLRHHRRVGRGRAKVAERARRRPTTWRRSAGWSSVPARRPAGRRWRAVVAASSERTARQHDVARAAGDVEPLARTCRYGNVRGVDDGGGRRRARHDRRAGLRSACPAACAALDDDAAARDARGDRRGAARDRAAAETSRRDAWQRRPGRRGRSRPRARLGRRPGQPAAARRRRARPRRGGRAAEPAAVVGRPGRRRGGLAGRLPGRRVGAAAPRPGAARHRRRLGRRRRRGRPSTTCCRCCAGPSPASSRPSGASIGDARSRGSDGARRRPPPARRRTSTSTGPRPAVARRGRAARTGRWPS